LESACAFILRAGSRTLSTWNSCACHLCITLNIDGVHWCGGTHSVARKQMRTNKGPGPRTVSRAHCQLPKDLPLDPISQRFHHFPIVPSWKPSLYGMGLWRTFHIQSIAVYISVTGEISLSVLQQANEKFENQMSSTLHMIYIHE
jgi:hypothetical protein